MKRTRKKRVYTTKKQCQLLSRKLNSLKNHVTYMDYQLQCVKLAFFYPERADAILRDIEVEEETKLEFEL